MSSVRALVTGASRGIGAAVARRLASDGFSVIVNYRRDREAAESVCDEIRRDGGNATPAQFDVADPARTEEALRELLSDERPIGVLVNNAGVVADAPFPAMGLEQWERVTRTTLDGFLQRDSAACHADGSAEIGADHQHVVDQWTFRQSWTGELRGREGRHRRRDKVPRDRAREAKDHRERGGSWHHRYGDDGFCPRICRAADDSCAKDGYCRRSGGARLVSLE